MKNRNRCEAKRPSNAPSVERSLSVKFQRSQVNSTAPLATAMTSERKANGLYTSPDVPMSRVRVEEIAIEAIRPYARNARRHGASQIEKLKQSILSFGNVNPILIDRKGTIICGHGRYQAATALGLKRVPTITLDHLNPAQVRKLRIADNRLAELSQWDERLLGEELFSLDADGFDVSDIGFDDAELDRIFGEFQVGDGCREDDVAADSVQAVRAGEPAVTQRGDIWQLGPHRLACADSREAAAMQALLGGDLADLIITDPPYNIRIQGFASGKGKARHKNFAMAAGEMSEREFRKFLRDVLVVAKAAARPGALIYSFMDWRHIEDLIAVGREELEELVHLCVWVKQSGGMGTLYRSQHELVAVFKARAGSAINNVQLGRFGRNRTNVWHYDRPTGLTVTGRDELALHPTVKPARMIADAIQDACPRNGIVLDMFAGSGTVFISCEMTGRRARGIEIDPGYVDACVRRWQEYTGNAAVHAATGETFAVRAAKMSGTPISRSATPQPRETEVEESNKKVLRRRPRHGH